MSFLNPNTTSLGALTGQHEHQINTTNNHQLSNTTNNHQHSNSQKQPPINNNRNSTQTIPHTTTHQPLQPSLQPLQPSLVRPHQEDNESWGDVQQIPSSGTVRIGFQNIGPQRTSGWTYHAKTTTKHIQKGRYDAFLFADYGIH